MVGYRYRILHFGLIAISRMVPIRRSYSIFNEWFLNENGAEPVVTDNARELFVFCAPPLHPVPFGHSPERV